MEFQCAGQKPKIYFALPKKKKKKAKSRRRPHLWIQCAGVVFARMVLWWRKAVGWGGVAWKVGPLVAEMVSLG